MQVKDVMTRTVETVSAATTLDEAAERMRALNIGSLPVREGDAVVGMITDRDMAVRAIARGLDPNTTTVGDVMTPSVVSCFDDQTIDEAAGIMAAHHVRRLVVFDRAERLAGIVSLDNVAVEAHDPKLAGETLGLASTRSEQLQIGYQRILVALDGSKFAERVLPYVESLAQKFGSRVTLLRVVMPVEEPSPVEATVGAMRADGASAETSPISDAMRHGAVSYLREVQQRLQARGLAVECETPEGSASNLILHRARRLGVDLIAMTTHGRSGVDRMVFGSVAEDVLRRAPCPVLLVRGGDGR